MSKTVSWNEDVLLGNGQMLQVQRTATYGSDEWFRAGRGPLKEQTIRFDRDGHSFEWKNDDRWTITYMPEILDFASGMPVLVMPVQGWGPCHKYGFPPEGLAAFGHKQGRWDRIATADLPKELKINLLRSTHEIRYSKEYKDKQITPLDKQALELSGQGDTQQGQSLADASKQYVDKEESCVRMRPPPDKQLEELRQRNSDAERNASTIPASVLSVDTEPKPVTSEMFLSQRGVWTGAGFLAGSCEGIVEKIEPLSQWTGDAYGARSELIGYQLLLQVAPADKKKAQIEGARAQMHGVVCDQSTIFVVRRQNKANLIIHRFGHNGDLIDAFRVALPDTAKVVSDPGWGTLWTVTPDDKGNLSMSVVDYTYPLTADQGGTIKRKVNYAVHLPAR